jgi:uncharacterized protein (UPF0548 family)
MVALLPKPMASALRSAPFSYDEVGATAAGLPAGYAHLERSRALPLGVFEAGAARLMAWQVHEAAGLRVAASDRQVEQDSVVEMFLGPRWLGVRAVCRVAYVIDESDRVGFAYGTLAGHPESGEEAFVLERLDGVVRFTVRAFSRPATRLARLGGPVTTMVQRAMAARYLAAVAPAAASTL